MTWLEVSIKQICDVDWGNTKLTKSSYVAGGKFLAVSASGADGLIDHYEHEANVPVLSAIGAQCGRMFYPGERFTAIKNTITLTPKAEMADGKFLFYLFTSVQLPQRGAGQPFISKGDIEAFRVLIPESLEEQRQIVEKLDSAFAEIDLLEENLARSSDSIMEIEASLVANLWVKYAKELSKTHLNEVAQYKNGTAHEKIVDKNGKFIIVNSKFISSNGLKFKKSSQQLAPLNIGDVVMVLSDVPNGKALAKCFLVDKDETYTLNQRICKLTSEVLLPEFLALNVNRNPYLLSFNNGENQTNLRLNDVLKTPIYVTDKKTQKLIIDEFVEAKNTIVGYSTLNMRKAESLLTLRQSLLSSVFSELESYAS